MTAVSQRETLEFLKALFKNKFAEAERLLQQLEEKYPTDSKYIHALRGIYTSYTGDDHDSLIYMLYLNEEFSNSGKAIRQYFEKLSKLLCEDERYFAAWIDILKLLDKLPQPLKITAKQQR